MSINSQTTSTLKDTGLTSAPATIPFFGSKLGTEPYPTILTMSSCSLWFRPGLLEHISPGFQSFGHGETKPGPIIRLYKWNSHKSDGWDPPYIDYPSHKLVSPIKMWTMVRCLNEMSINRKTLQEINSLYGQKGSIIIQCATEDDCEKQCHIITATLDDNPSVLLPLRFDLSWTDDESTRPRWIIDATPIKFSSHDPDDLGWSFSTVAFLMIPYS